jgi:hypothetical protein
MSLLTLPPIWKRWTQEDLEHLTTDELNELWKSLHLNEMLLIDRYEYIKFFKDRKNKSIKKNTNTIDS